MCTTTGTFWETELVRPPDGKAAVAVTASVKEVATGTVIFNPASWACVNVQVPSPLLVPAENVTPGGTFAMVTVTTEVASPGLALMLSEMGAPRCPSVGRYRQVRRRGCVHDVDREYLVVAERRELVIGDANAD